MLMGIEIRHFLVIDAFSRFSGMAFARSADQSLILAKETADSTTVVVSCRGRSTGADVATGCWRGFRIPRRNPRITRFRIPPRTRWIAVRTRQQDDVGGTSSRCRICGGLTHHLLLIGALSSDGFCPHERAAGAATPLKLPFHGAENALLRVVLRSEDVDFTDTSDLIDLITAA